MTTIKRYLLLLAHEFRLVRTTLPIHIVAILEPAIMYALMTVILVYPTLDMNVFDPTTDASRNLISAMETVGSPIGLPYIHPVPVDTTEPLNMRQVIVVETQDEQTTAVQRFNLIDDNLVKNYRNRLTAAALLLWNTALGDRAVTVIEHPSYPQDISYNVYFGMAMLPLAAFIAAALIGGVVTAQEYEFHMIHEYRLAPTGPALVLLARLTRLVISSLVAAGLLLLLIGLINGYWPNTLWQVVLILVLVSLIAGCVGIVVGLLLRRTLPTFLTILVMSVIGWILGSAFKPAVSIGGWYLFASRLTINTYAVDLLFPAFYQTGFDAMPRAWMVLALVAGGMLVVTSFVYRRRVSLQE